MPMPVRQLMREAVGLLVLLLLLLAAPGVFSVAVPDAVSASPSASSASPSASCTHGPQSRACWRDGFDIYSDYTDREVVPSGKLVEYDFTVSEQVIAPDGYDRPGMVVNGQYPGPTIEADWGDTIRVTVHNNLTNGNGTAIHWHGIQQYMTNWMDGAPGATECPIPPGGTQVYEFRATHYGSTWYHSHFDLQYSNGVYGPLVINGPSSANYDVDLGPWLLSDWYHEDVFSLEWMGLTAGLAAVPVSNVLNGKGVFDCNPANDTRCTGDAAYYEVAFEKGKSYRLSIMNTATILTYSFWIDGHDLTVIQTDFVPIEPYVTDVLVVGIGQRYEIIVEANADFEHGSNFWVHAQFCDMVDIVPNKQVGIIRYDESDTSDPYTPPPDEQFRDSGCADPDPNDLVPVVKQRVPSSTLVPDSYLKMGQQPYPDPYDPDPPAHYWVLKDIPMELDWAEPSIRKLTTDKANATFPPKTAPITLDLETGTWVSYVLAGNFSQDSVDPPRNRTRSVHPIHLHGHSFAILAQGDGIFSEQEVVPNLDNPARRDVVNVPIGGFAWIAFRIDNPGVWLMHCHIAFHISAGMALQILEQPSQLEGVMEEAGALELMEKRCQAWEEYIQSEKRV